MRCPRCKILCKSTDISSEVVCDSLDFKHTKLEDKEGMLQDVWYKPEYRGGVCPACISELNGKPYC